jgi:hypothetical protein
MIVKAALFLLIAIGFGGLTRAADDPAHPPLVYWSAKDINGREVRISGGERATIIAFIRPAHEQSTRAIEAIKQKSSSPAAPTQVLIILSGPTASDDSKQIAPGLPGDWFVIPDADFVSSGAMDIHAWPTTVVVKSDGTQVAHLAGMPPSFAADLASYLEFAAGKLDQAALQKRLNSQDVVAESAEGIAQRHLQMAERLLDQRADPARVRSELAQIPDGLPFNPEIEIARARILAMLEQPEDALEMLDELKRWADAEKSLRSALESNPQAAEGRYLLGLCLQQKNNWQQAAGEFRQAFEQNSSARKGSLTTRP